MTTDRRTDTFTGSFATSFAVDETDESRPITVEALTLPWGVTVQLNCWGDTVAFQRGSIAPSDAGRVKFLLDHRAKPFGYATGFADREEGLWATFAIPREELADDEVAAAVRQMRNGVRDAVSIGAAITKADETGGPEPMTTHYDVTAAELLEVSSVVIPRFADARIARIAATHGGNPAMPTATLPAVRGGQPEEPDVPDVPDDDKGGDDERVQAHRRALAGLDPVRALAALTATRGRYRTFGDYVMAVATGAIEPGYRDRVEAAWTDELTTDVPGIVPEQWMREIIDLMGTVSATVDLFSSRPLPDSGMTLHVPRLDQGPDVGPQTAEKTEIASRKVLIGDVQFPVGTFAGGQDVSIQTILRTEPAYLDELMRLFAREMALQVNISANAALVAGTTQTSPLSAADVNGSVIDAAVLILNGTYSFPEVMLLGVNVWAAIGKATDDAGRPLFPTYSPMNPVGSFRLTDDAGAVRDLGWRVDPSMDPNLAIVGLRDAFRTWRSPMRTLSVDVPRLLGRDVAVFEFAAYGVTDARVLVKMTLGATAAAAKRAAS